MNAPNNAEYYRRRAAEAEARADAATLPEARRAHSEMAVRYTALRDDADRQARLAAARPTLGIVHPG